MKKIAILGAGITGLASAYYLQKEQIDVTIFEKNDRVGGWLNTISHNDALFECGPRSIRSSSKELMELIDELGLTPIATQAKKRYIIHQGKVEALPSSLKGLFTTKLGRTMLGALVRELFSSKEQLDDESVASFFSRRIGKPATDIFINALCAGIYAASPDKLSMRSCFTALWEHKKSLLRYKSKGNMESFSFKGGIKELPDALASKLEGKICLNRAVSKVYEQDDKVVVDGEAFDYLFSTIAPASFAKMVPQGHPLAAISVPATSVVSISLAYEEPISIPDGFGFLCPEQEDSKLLGALFDSNLFREHNGSYKTRLTLMLGGSRAPDMGAFSDDVLLAYAKDALKKYLGIAVKPDFHHIVRAESAIAAYPVGHYRTCQQLEEYAGKIRLLGSGLYGVSIGDSVTSASDFTKNYLTNNVSKK